MVDVLVSNSAELKKAIAGAKAGDTILLASGDYGAVKISKVNLASDVTITSQNVKNPAHVDSITITGSSHIVIKGVDVGYALAPGQPNFAQMIAVNGSSAITFDKVSVHGSLDDDPGNDGRGISVLGSSNVKIVNSTFEQLGRGVMIGSTTDVVLKNNAFHDLRSDGADLSDVQRVLIEGNTFRDFFPGAGDHPDAIQFFTRGSKQSSSDITIVDNQIFQGSGSGIQGIFLTDSVGTLPFTNVKISNNLVYVPDGYNGITIMGGKNVAVLDNTVVSPENDRSKLWIRLERIDGGVVEKNLADTIINAGNSGLVVKSNVFLDQSAKTAQALSAGLNAEAAATAQGLHLDNFGFQVSHSAGTPAVAPVVTSQASTDAPAPQDVPAVAAQPAAPLPGHVKVANAAELKAALAAAKGGEVIELASGNYGDVKLTDKTYASKVTLVSADPTHEAVIGTLLVRNGGNLSISDVDIGVGGSATKVTLTKATGVSFDHVDFHGSLDGDANNDGNGMTVASSTNISVTNSEFHQLDKGIVVSESTGVMIGANDFHDLSGDGLNFAAVTDIHIVENNFFTFDNDAGASNAMKFWTSGTTTASSQIEIAGNEIMQGGGSALDGIAMNDSGGKLAFTNVKISDNLIYSNEATTGITVLGGNNVEVTNNTVVSQTTDKRDLLVRLEKITGGMVSDNLIDSLAISKSTGVEVADNMALNQHRDLALKIAGINMGADATAANFVIDTGGFDPVSVANSFTVHTTHSALDAVLTI